MHSGNEARVQNYFSSRQDSLKPDVLYDKLLTKPPWPVNFVGAKGMASRPFPRPFFRSLSFNPTLAVRFLVLCLWLVFSRLFFVYSVPFFFLFPVSLCPPLAGPCLASTTTPFCTRYPSRWQRYSKPSGLLDGFQYVGSLDHCGTLCTLISFP